MGQLTFKLPDEELRFLRYVADRTGSSLSSIYREKTLDHFVSWKKNYLLDEYAKGAIGFKQMCKLANISLNEGMLWLEEEAIEPPIPALVDEYTDSVRKRLTPELVFKKGSVPKRKAPEVQ